MAQQLRHPYAFGDFRIEAEERLLRRGDDVISLPPKAVDLLIVLLENHGRVVSKEELFARVWENQFVEEANLSHTIFQLRKILGGKSGKFIETIPKRGYRFVADVKELFEDENEIVVGEQTLTRISVEEEIEMSEPPAVVGGSNVGIETHPLPQAVLTKRAILFSIVLLALIGLLFVGFVYFNRETKTAAGKLPPHFARITDTKKHSATISRDGKLIAYAQNYTFGEGTLFVRQVDTNKEIKLLEPAERFFGTTEFSPDGAFVYYIEHKKDAPHGNLFRVSTFGGQPTKMVDNVNYMFALSPDGRSAVFFRGDEELKQHYLTVAALDGTGAEQKVMTTRYSETQIAACVAWSPDARFVAFSAVEKNIPAPDTEPRMYIFTVEIATGEVRKLSRDAFLDMGKMTWTADGNSVVFVGYLPRAMGHIFSVSYPQGESKRLTQELNTFGSYGLGITGDGNTLVADLWESSQQIWTTEAVADGNAEKLTSGDNDGDNGIAALPNGGIIYASRTGETTDLWKISGDKTESLTTDDFTELDVCAAPDGSFLVFSSNRAGNSHLFRMEASDLSVRQLTFGDGFEGSPDISPDGNWIVYNSGWTISKMPSAGGAGVQLTDYDAVVPAFSPDGKMISCILPSEKVTENATLAVISSDGGKPLKEFPVQPFGWHYRAPRWTPDGTAITFRKTEKSITNLWRQNLTGEKPQPLTDFKSEDISNYIFSRDGKRLITARGHFGGGVALIKNFK